VPTHRPARSPGTPSRRSSGSPGTPSRRSSWIAAFIAAPAVASAVALTAIETYRLIEPQAAFFGGPAPASLAESIIDGFGVEQTYQFIRAGQDPNGPIAVNHPDYTEGKTVMASPLLLAVAAEDGSAVLMLLSFGARLDLPQNRHVECLAKEIRLAEIARMIADARGEGAPPVCSGRKPDAATLLLAWAD
jgi:hypothetical protein